MLVEGHSVIPEGPSHKGFMVKYLGYLRSRSCSTEIVGKYIMT